MNLPIALFATSILPGGKHSMVFFLQGIETAHDGETQDGASKHDSCNGWVCLYQFRGQPARPLRHVAHRTKRHHGFGLLHPVFLQGGSYYDDSRHSN